MNGDDLKVINNQLLSLISVYYKINTGLLFSMVFRKVRGCLLSYEVLADQNACGDKSTKPGGDFRGHSKTLGCL